MVPADFITYFATMAAVGGTLFGLIFITVSIVPETVVQKGAPLGRQVRATGSYNALLNPLIVSLFALVPHNSIAHVTLVIGVIGLINTIVMAISIFPHVAGWREQFNNILFILGGLILYGFETYYGLRLFLLATDTDALYSLTTILILLYIFGLARAWDLIGIRQFHVQELFMPHDDKKV